ncbi:DUF262 domain-containing protein [Kineosporia mesophila]|uniref:DUF262 domain-containing protein n=1 Tax=Kineosporia mesophila TaxID=566012 RepID=A0ABP7A040_9ACTN|nr:DUF262 domain-containing protein [Kineosporia mesophila]MCD5353235.1 DUF262 domain-containing protein [Kineosporia mesophila]
MVHAAETSLKVLLEGTKQYLVPLYQRTYSWSRQQHVRLWEDVLKLAEDRSVDHQTTHFIGSLVLAPAAANGPAGVQQFLVVDGQQRLTTLSLLLCAIRDHRGESEGANHRERLNEQYLINKWEKESLRSKLLPTQVDRASYQSCLESTPHAGAGDPIGKAYNYFRSQLRQPDEAGNPIDLAAVEDAVIQGLSLVCVTAQAGDNVHRIFESLNNTGLQLTQGDLLRNYLFMRLPSRGDKVYSNLWLPLQKTLSSDELETLFWLDLVRDDARVKRTDTYNRQQVRLNRLSGEDAIEAAVKRFARLGTLFAVILHPEQETDADVRRGLQRLYSWDTTTVYPLLLHLLDQRDTGAADSATVARTLTIIESFLVRRLLMGRATNNVNRVLLGAVAELRANRPLDEAVRDYLSTGRKYYATDRELLEGIEHQSFYFNGAPHQRALVLRWLEEHLGSKEPVNLSNLTIEHVLPQTLTAFWEQALSTGLEADETVEDVHSQVLHTLGNLTLTGYNSELSNGPFDKKRTVLATSGVRMNQEIAENEVWGRAQILARAAVLAQRAVSIWPGPSSQSPSGASELWQLLDSALTELPAGSWTTYGDLAALIGTHPVPLGMRLSTHPAPNAHRVLQAGGTVSPGFRWPNPDRDDDPLQILRSEGVTIDDAGRADPGQRVTVEELAELVGLSTDGLQVLPDLAPGQDRARRDRFLGQLTTANDISVVNGVLRLLDRWTADGGELVYGNNAQTSCFPVVRTPLNRENAPWPVAIYPAGKVEVVFKHMASRPPFNDLAMREEFRLRLNAIDGIDLSASKIQLRPSFPLDVLSDEKAVEQLADAFSWFLQVTWQANS